MQCKLPINIRIETLSAVNIGAKMISWKYNGVHVYSDDDEPYKKVFIKKANGKTTVSLTR